MNIFKNWRNARLREHASSLDLEKFRSDLEHGADPLQPVLDPLGANGEMTTLLHALLAWPNDPQLVYQNQDCRRSPKDGIGLPQLLGIDNTDDAHPACCVQAILLEKFVRICMTHGVDPETPDSKGVTIRQLADRTGRTNWLPFKISQSAGIFPRSQS